MQILLTHNPRPVLYHQDSTEVSQLSPVKAQQGRINQSINQYNLSTQLQLTQQRGPIQLKYI